MKPTYSQIYYKKNKDKLLKYVKEKTKCECGATVARINLSRHRKSNKHKIAMNTNETLEENLKNLLKRVKKLEKEVKKLKNMINED